ncbi:pyrroline-5-carboxylate reductase family protein [Streptomyces sp. WG-D5]
MQRVVVMGAGHMGSLIAAGVRRSLPGTRLAVVDVSPAHIARAREAWGVEATPRYAGEPGDLVVLAVPPQAFEALAAAAPPAAYADATVVSVMAGVGLGTLTARLGTTQVVRAMPNAAAEVGAGLTVLCPAADVTDARAAAARRVMGTVGAVVETHDEAALDAATALCGGGPAFTACFAQELVAYASEAGFDAATARVMAAQLLIGTARLLTEADRSPEDVQRAVATPGGTTEQGLRALRDGGLAGTVRTALDRSAARSRELGRVAALDAVAPAEGPSAR